MLSDDFLHDGFLRDDMDGRTYSEQGDQCAGGATKAYCSVRARPNTSKKSIPRDSRVGFEVRRGWLDEIHRGLAINRPPGLVVVLVVSNGDDGLVTRELQELDACCAYGMRPVERALGLGDSPRNFVEKI